MNVKKYLIIVQVILLSATNITVAHNDTSQKSATQHNKNQNIISANAFSATTIDGIIKNLRDEIAQLQEKKSTLEQSSSLLAFIGGGLLGAMGTLGTIAHAFCLTGNIPAVKHKTKYSYMRLYTKSWRKICWAAGHEHHPSKYAPKIILLLGITAPFTVYESYRLLKKAWNHKEKTVTAIKKIEAKIAINKKLIFLLAKKT